MRRPTSSAVWMATTAWTVGEELTHSPVVRVTSADVPMPYNKHLEKAAKVSALAKDVSEFLAEIGLQAPAQPTGQVVAYPISQTTQEDGICVETVPDVDAAAERLGPRGPGDAVLLKGSRVAGLERLADRLLADGD